MATCTPHTLLCMHLRIIPSLLSFLSLIILSTPRFLPLNTIILQFSTDYCLHWSKFFIKPSTLSSLHSIQNSTNTILAKIINNLVTEDFNPYLGCMFAKLCSNHLHTNFYFSNFHNTIHLTFFHYGLPPPPPPAPRLFFPKLYQNPIGPENSSQVII